MRLKINIFLVSVLMLLTTLTGHTIKAATVTNYSATANLTYNGTPINGTTGDVNIPTYAHLQYSSTITFPDSQAINSGDTYSFDIPKEFRFPGALAPFNIVNKAGTIIGTATVNALSTPNNLTVTFNDFYSKVNENKNMTLSFDLIANNNTLTNGEKVNTVIPNTNQPSSFTFGSNKNVTPGSAINNYTFKYSYHDTINQDVIHWVVIANAIQDPIENLVVTDTLGSNQYMTAEDKAGLRFRELEIKENDPIDSESEAKGRTITASLRDQVVYTPTDNSTSFTYATTNNNFTTINGKDYGHAYYITYTTHINRQQAGSQSKFTNTVNLSGSNLTQKTQTANYTDDNATGTGDAICSSYFRNTKTSQRSRPISKSIRIWSLQ
ncbi:hypothetical protein HMPREF9318_01745 [Streptococcus urinalis FB127-CNA-2]|uniref:collagen binding domain-containing protein n=1 Tax=Streptococcus urinalis TaxID=149016 RepID=UPI0002992277|nr:collagen binding domain-containing protein [Streptococcus urinalis]EKS18246.1 hypothetical protein HMPREF9318_01745 [Streptococcus urinalis FB127-CNA-2]